MNSKDEVVECFNRIAETDRELAHAVYNLVSAMLDERDGAHPETAAPRDVPNEGLTPQQIARGERSGVLRDAVKTEAVCPECGRNPCIRAYYCNAHNHKFVPDQKSICLSCRKSYEAHC